MDQRPVGRARQPDNGMTDRGCAAAVLRSGCGRSRTGRAHRLAAVVRVDAEIPAAAYLGSERDGAGVVIDDGGLVVTIGYLIIEAMIDRYRYLKLDTTY